MSAAGLDRKAPINGRLGRLALQGLLLSFLAALATGAMLLAQDLAGLAWDTSAQGVGSVLVLAVHLAAGAAACLLLPAYVVAHLRKVSWRRGRVPRAGRILALAGVALLLTGLVVTRGLPWFELRDATWRAVLAALHAALTVGVVYGFVAHRGRDAGAVRGLQRLAVLAALAGIVAMPLAMRPDAPPPAASADRFAPALLDTSIERPVAADLRQDDYCKRCHEDTHERWSQSAHRFASFNNPFYRAAVMETRRTVMARDGTVEAARFCAGCHDPLPLLTGAFDRPDFDPDRDPTADAGITCLTCHAVTRVDSVVGNADLTIGAVRHYPFALSDQPVLRAIGDFLVRAHPEPHRAAMLKPLHRSPAFCGSCHKVHLPEALNKYRWLRGQNHYDSFRLSGVAGHNVDSFHYPPQARENCQSCHMPPQRSKDFGARRTADGTVVSDHLFPGANTALPWVMLKRPEAAIEAHRRMLEGSVSVDIVGLRRDGKVEGEFIGPLGDSVVLEPGADVLAQVVLRNRRTGHAFTEGTTDSNQAWLQVRLLDGEQLLASSGLPRADGSLPPDTHQVRNHVVDRQGRRIARRNVQDLHTVVYNRQIPPGAADVVHLRLRVPPSARPLVLEARLLYRKFDTEYTAFALGASAAAARGPLPVVEVGADRVRIDVGAAPVPVAPATALAPGERDRLLDYGIALLRKAAGAQQRQAEQVLRRLHDAGDVRGSLNLVRLHLREGHLDAAESLLRDTDWRALDNPWTVDWLLAQVLRDRSRHREAAELLERLVSPGHPRALERGFDFGRDDRLLLELGNVRLAQAFAEPPGAAQAALLDEAGRRFSAVLALDPENARAHHALSLVASQRGDMATAVRHREMHARYKPDEAAAEDAVTLARASDPVLDRLARSVTIHELR